MPKPSNGTKRATREQREVEAALRAEYLKEFGVEEADTTPTCTSLRRELRVFIDFLRGQAEALEKPVQRAKTLTKPLPQLRPKYKGITILDVLCDVEDLGKVAKRSVDGK